MGASRPAPMPRCRKCLRRPPPLYHHTHPTAPSGWSPGHGLWARQVALAVALASVQGLFSAPRAIMRRPGPE